MTAVRSGIRLETLVGRNSDRIKAALIVVVAADHNDWFRQLAPAVFEPLTFHVLGFFLLAFSFGQKSWSIRFVADRIARYLVPFWWALSAASLAFFLMYRGSATPSSALTDWALAAVIGNAPFVKSASGLLMLWFLPSLFGLACLLAIFNSLGTSRLKYLALGLALAAHLLIPVLPRLSMLWLPFGLAIAMNVFVLGLLWKQLLNCQLPRFWGASAAAVFLASYGALVAVPVHIEIATLELVGMEAPSLLLLQDLSGMAGVLTVVWLVGLPRQLQWFEAIGRNSLLVYLLHPVVYVALGKLWPSAPKDDLAPLVLFLHGCLTTGVAVVAAYAASVVVVRSRFLSAWIIPKSWAQWPPAKLLVGARSP